MSIRIFSQLIPFSAMATRTLRANGEIIKWYSVSSGIEFVLRVFGFFSQTNLELHLCWLSRGADCRSDKNLELFPRPWWGLSSRQKVPPEEAHREVDHGEGRVFNGGLRPPLKRPGPELPHRL